MCKWHFLVLILFHIAHAATPVIYPKEETPNDPRMAYPVKLLELGLKKSGGDYLAQPSRSIMQQGRAISELESGAAEPTILWTMTSREREATLLPIRIPLEKGLIGWRIPLVTQAKVDQFKGVSSLEALKKFRAGQGHDWPDTEILRSNGIDVQGAPQYPVLFPMLVANRFDYFPRSISEIWAEVDVHQSEKLVADPAIVLRYPAAIYFFVNKHNSKLAADLQAGLEKALADGSFNALFHQYQDPIIQRAKLEKRVIIDLKNPLLPAETPLARTELWFQFNGK